MIQPFSTSQTRWISAVMKKSCGGWQWNEAMTACVEAEEWQVALELFRTLEDDGVGDSPLAIPRGIRLVRVWWVPDPAGGAASRLVELQCSPHCMQKGFAMAAVGRPDVEDLDLPSSFQPFHMSHHFSVFSQKTCSSPSPS